MPRSAWRVSFTNVKHGSPVCRSAPLAGPYAGTACPGPANSGGGGRRLASSRLPSPQPPSLTPLWPPASARPGHSPGAAPHLKNYGSPRARRPGPQCCVAPPAGAAAAIAVRRFRGNGAPVAATAAGGGEA